MSLFDEGFGCLFELLWYLLRAVLRLPLALLEFIFYLFELLLHLVTGGSSTSNSSASKQRTKRKDSPGDKQ